MQNIPLSDHNISRLRRLGEAYVDTFDSIIGRLLDHFEKPQGASTVAAVAQSNHGLPTVAGDPNVRELDPFAPVSLTHTKVTWASFGGKDLVASSWNGLLDEAVRVAAARFRPLSAMRKIVPVNMVEGRKSDEGYHFLSDVGLSVQGQDANDAWLCVAHVARQLGCAVEVHFFWRTREGAAYPGEHGKVSFGGR